jgi:hypothetical protein
MDVDELGKLAMTLTENEFSARFPHLFFLFQQAKDGISPLNFHTEVIDPSSGRGPAGRMRVIPLVKAPSSPYSDRISIGRARNCDVVLRDGSVSKLHAHVRKEDDGSFVLIDLGSHNGTKIHDVRVSPNQPAKVRSGDVVTIGGVTVRVADAPAIHSLLSRLFA